MPIDGDPGTPEHDAHNRPTWLIVIFTVSGSLIAFGITLVLSLIESRRIQPTWPAIAALLVGAGIASLLHRFPELAEQLVRWLGGAAHGAFSSVLRGLRAAVRGGLGRLRAAPAALAAFLDRHPIPFPRRLVIYATVIALGVTVGRAAAGGWLTSSPGPGDAVPCHDPLELRVLTSPDNRDSVQTAADAFAADQARDRRCRPVHISVDAQASFSDLVQGFAGGWQDPSQQVVHTGVAQFLGPQPDIWLPASTAEAHYIADRPHPDVRLDDEGSVATSPLVFAVPADYFQRVAQNLPNPEAPTWSDLLAAAPKAGLRVARPDPTVSEAGLLATTDLYRASHAAGDSGNDQGNGSGDRARRSVEEGIAALGAPLSNAHDLLCPIRTIPRPDVAVVVPEQALQDYNQGKPLGVRCSLPIPRPATSYTPFQPGDAHALDYPFVRVTWRDQADATRDAMIDRFRDWLAGGRLQSSGFRDKDGRIESVQLPNTKLKSTVRRFDGAEIARTIGEYRRARLLVTVAFVIDVSGSMDTPTLERVSQLDRARELVAQALDFLGPSDSAGLYTFPRGRATDDVNSAVRAQVAPAAADHIADDLRPALSGLGRADGGSTPLYNAIDDAARSLAGKGDNPAVVVLSDGDDHVRGGIDATELGRRLAGTQDPPRIVVLATGRRGCHEQDLTDLMTAAPARTAVCHEAASGAADGLISLVFAELRKDGAR